MANKSVMVTILLMVVVTVILTAVIATSVFNMAGESTDGGLVVIAKRIGNDVYITNYGGQGSENLQLLTVSNEISSVDFPSTAVGTSVKIPQKMGLPTKIVVVATYKSGQHKTVLDTTI